MLEIKINGQIFSGFTSARVVKTMKSLSGTFEFIAGGDLTYSKLKELGLVITKDSIVEILADGIKIMTAYIERQSIGYSNNRYSVVLSGREVTCDIIDCKIAARFTNTKNTNFINLAEAVFKSENLNYKIVNNTISNNSLTDFQSTDFQMPSTGEAVIDFLNRYALKKYIVLLTDKDGNFELANSGDGYSTLSSYKLRNTLDINSNIYSANVNYDQSQLYNTYTFKSIPGYQDPTTSNLTANQQSNVSYTGSPDNNIRVGRNFLEVESESFAVAKLKDRVSWKLQTQIAQSRQYNVTLDGHTFTNDSSQQVILEPNQLVNIIDKTCNINEDMLINQIEYKMDNNGNTTFIEFVQKDTYNLVAEDVILSNVYYGTQSI